MTEADALHLTHQHIRKAMGERPANRRHHPEAVLADAETLVDLVEAMRAEYVELARVCNPPVQR